MKVGWILAVKTSQPSNTSPEIDQQKLHGATPTLHQNLDNLALKGFPTVTQ
jgi:hypothetical protein